MASKKDTAYESRFSGFNYDPNKLTIIGLDTKDGEEHHMFDERNELPVDEGLVVSMMAIGIKEPVIISKEGENTIVVDGRQRVRAAREANKRLKKLGDPLLLVPCKMEQGSEDYLMEVAVATNELRRQDEIWVKASKAHRMLNRGHDDKTVARAFGVTNVTVKNWMKLLELPAPVKKAIDKGALSPSAAVKLHGMEKADMLEKLKELTEEHAKTGKKASKSKVEKKRNGKQQTARRPSKKALVETVDVLSQYTGAFLAGAMAGIRFTLGEEIPEINDVLAQAAAEAEEEVVEEEAEE